MNDTGCAHASRGGVEQYREYCHHVGKSEIIDKSDVAKCKFGVGSATSIGRVSISFPIEHIVLKIKMYIVDADVPLLLLLTDMDKLRHSFDNLSNNLAINLRAHFLQSPIKIVTPFYSGTCN